MLLTALKCLGAGLLLLAFAIVMLRALFPLPSRTDRSDTAALPPDNSGALAKKLAGRAARHEGLSGIASLQTGKQAFAARILLADAAVSSIDIQYYIWRADMTGYLLLDALQRAAARGVRVRLLLDDNGISGLDGTLAALNARPNIEIRLFNPFNLRRFKRLSYAFDFFRLNRRMHNKSFTVDGLASVLGGRNVGDEYFGTGVNPLQVDLDVLAVGDIVTTISADFDRYWTSRPVHPAGPILRKSGDPDPVGTALAKYRSDPQFKKYCDLLKSSGIVADLARGDLALEWTNVVLVSDAPAKGEGNAKRGDLFTTRLNKAVGRIESRLDGVTPYFVPGAAGVKAFGTLEERGVTVRMLTNGLEATNMLPVHAGYAKRRTGMLRAGVQLFEMRAQAGAAPPPSLFGPLGSSGSNLHAKTFAVDGTRIFIGSFNFDPRSVTLNTEMGLLIESSRMAGALHRAFDGGLSDHAWRVQLRGTDLAWVDANAGTETSDEPGSTPVKRLVLAIISRWPFEWLL